VLSETTALYSCKFYAGLNFIFFPARLSFQVFFSRVPPQLHKKKFRELENVVFLKFSSENPQSKHTLEISENQVPKELWKFHSDNSSEYFWNTFEKIW